MESQSLSLNWGGIDLGAWPYGVLVLQHTRPVMADVKSKQMDYAARDGGLVGEQFLQPIAWTLRCTTKADGLAGLDRKAELLHRLDAIRSVINPKNAKAFVYLTGDTHGEESNRGAFVKVIGGIDGDLKGGATYVDYDIHLIAEAGYFETINEETDAYAIASSPDSFVSPKLEGTISGASNVSPIVITDTAHGLSTGMTVVVESVGGNAAANGTHLIRKVDNDSFELVRTTGNGAYTSGGTWKRAMPGTLYEYPVYILRNTTGGNITSVILANATTGETLNWTGTLADDDYLRIDSDLETIESSSDLLAWTDELGGLGAGDPFPRLKPRVTNSITVTGLSSGTLDIQHRGRFL